MNFTPVALGGTTFVSDCGQYDLRAAWTDGHYAWRGRHIDSDRLIWSSADRGYVEGCCARHAASAIAEHTS